MPRAKAPPAVPASPDDIEQQFYQALRRADLDGLMRLWSDDDDVVCVHPGGARLVGPGAVRAAFEAIFANGAIDVHAERVRRLEAHGLAVHSVLERVQLAGAQGEASGWVIATNVYVNSPQGWRIVAHHASPGTPQEPSEGAEFVTTLH